MNTATNNKTFPLKWEVMTTRHSHINPSHLPYRIVEREKLASIMDYDQIINTVELDEKLEMKRKHKWKELRFLYNIISNDHLGHTKDNHNNITANKQIVFINNRNSNFENCFRKYYNNKIAIEHFIMILMSEFRFDSNLGYDKHFRWLYWSLDGGNKNEVDIRDLVSLMLVLRYHRLIRPKTVELILKMFDVYSSATLIKNNEDGQHDIVKITADTFMSTIQKNPSSTTSKNNVNDILYDANPVIRKIFMSVPLTETDFSYFPPTTNILSIYDPNSINNQNLLKLQQQNEMNKLTKITRRQFERLLNKQEFSSLITLFSRFCWIRLPTDLRLSVMDEDQELALSSAENIFMRYKLKQALQMHINHLMKTVFTEWKLSVLREAGVRNHIIGRLYLRRKMFFRFWNALTIHKVIRRRRRMLAEVMGSYTIKARCFNRIKLFNFNTRRERVVVGGFNRKAKFFRLFETYVRQFKRLFTLRKHYHRWWNECVAQINQEVAIRHDWCRLLLKVLVPWRMYAHEAAVQTRMEAVTLENKIHFDRMMQQAEEAALFLAEAEKKKKEMQ
eukprot:gene13402-17970_t